MNQKSKEISNEIVGQQEWKIFRRSLNFMKIAGFIWFLGKLPEEYDGNFEILLYFNRFEEAPPAWIEGVKDLGGETMDYFSQLMPPPNWLPDRNKYQSLLLSETKEILSMYLLPIKNYGSRKNI